MTRLIVMLTAFLIGFAATAPANATGEPASPDKQIGAWIQALSQEEGFEAWRDAEWRKYPLGPGQHGWVVIVYGSGSEELGYLVALSTPSGKLTLGEYGLGESALFSPETLRQALSSEELGNEAFSEQAAVNRVYADAMHAFWKVSENGVVRYADAKLGMWLPIGKEDACAQPAALEPIVPTGERSHVLTEPADPYATLSWLGAPEAAVDGWPRFTELLHRKGGELWYISGAFEGKAPTPFGVAGYHWWPADTGQEASRLQGFVALEQEGLRYVPLEHLIQHGSFY